VLNKIIHDALMIWVTIEPIGTVALFAVLTTRLSPGERRKIATRAMAYSAIILLGAILIGQILLAAMNIQLISLQIAGGIILFLFGLQMIFGQAKAAFGQFEPGHDIAIFPLAIEATRDIREKFCAIFARFRDCAIIYLITHRETRQIKPPQS
jgi:multiple antibiotic resistance protein